MCVFIAPIVLYFAVSKAIFHAYVWKLRADLGTTKYELKRTKKANMKLRKERNEFAISLIKARHFEQRFNALIESSKKK